MEIKDLFSHKIHSSGDDWPNKLIDIATIFSEFDGKPFDRAAIESRLVEISPRASSVARDLSKFRDEISAYPAYLGLYRVELVNNEWYIFLSNTAKQFLICEEPNVAAFMLAQLTFFQYPNGMGAAYSSLGSLRIQANTRNRTLDFISKNVHLSPLRLICRAIQADSFINITPVLDSSVTFQEIFVLANDPRTNQNALPSLDNAVQVLTEFRNNKISPIINFESRFHILKHTNFLIPKNGKIKIRTPIGEKDADDLLDKFNAIIRITSEFNEFDGITTEEELIKKLRSCSWGKYFDALKSSDAAKVEIITSDNLDLYAEIDKNSDVIDSDIEVIKSEKIYSLKEFSFNEISTQIIGKKKVIYTDPELTRIRRQRANLSHKIVLEKLYSFLTSKGITPFENEHIDLFAKLNTSEKYVFEVKSATETNLLSQTRKGISQLYEYRYRYQEIIGYDVQLVLVFPSEPRSVPWLQEYLCTDRKIAVVWFDENLICHSSQCKTMVDSLLNS